MIKIKYAKIYPQTSQSFDIVMTTFNFKFKSKFGVYDVEQVWIEIADHLHW